MPTSWCVTCIASHRHSVAPFTAPALTLTLVVRCSQGHFVKNWKRRFFRLTSLQLAYYEHASDAEPKGSIQLAQIESILDKSMLVTRPPTHTTKGHTTMTPVGVFVGAQVVAT